MERSSAFTVSKFSLVQPLLKYWSRHNYSQVFIKSIVVILLWNFSTGLTYNLLFNPSSILQLEYIRDASGIIGVSSGIFLFSPFAGYLADVKLNRFNTLLYSTYIMTMSVILILVCSILFFCTVHATGLNIENGLNYQILKNTLYTVSFLFCGGKVFFQANILQFGTDQLRDAPTQCSVLFLYAYLWCDNFSNALTLSTNIPGHEIFIAQQISTDKTKVACFEIVFSTTILSSVLILVLLRKKKNWFFTENIGDNPYKLVTNVLCFAMRHKVPISRSAFTYCENEHISRIDFGKQRYGGPSQLSKWKMSRCS